MKLLRQIGDFILSSIFFEIISNLENLYSRLFILLKTAIQYSEDNIFLLPWSWPCLMLKKKAKDARVTGILKIGPRYGHGTGKFTVIEEQSWSWDLILITKDRIDIVLLWKIQFFKVFPSCPALTSAIKNRMYHWLVKIKHRLGDEIFF